jgi:hypothetical protein
MRTSTAAPRPNGPSDPPTARQLRCLRALSEITGTTFANPKTIREASVQIAAMQRRRREPHAAATARPFPSRCTAAAPTPPASTTASCTATARPPAGGGRKQASRRLHRVNKRENRMSRRPLSDDDLDHAQRTVRAAWLKLPHADRWLLQEIGASQWQVLDEPLGSAFDRLMRSAGYGAVERRVRDQLDGALGLWAPSLRVVLVDAGHAKLTGLDLATWEMRIAHAAWHEWGHALSLDRCSPEDIAGGARWLALSPPGVREAIRAAGYAENDYTHELIASVYALLVDRRCQEETGRPQWLDERIYELIQRVCGWNG